jgi:hypothetical protein
MNIYGAQFTRCNVLVIVVLCALFMLLQDLCIVSLSQSDSDQKLALNHITTSKDAAAPATFSVRHKWNVCHQFAEKTNNPHFSTSLLWDSLHHDLISATIQSQHQPPPPTFKRHVKDIFAWYTFDRLQLSLRHPARMHTMRSILQVLHDYPATQQPLEIYVYGGSVTKGMHCVRHLMPMNDTSLYDEGDVLHANGIVDMGTNFDCAWPSRLQTLLNHGVFGGKPRVRVTNLANSGYSSDISAFMIDHKIHLQDHPDIGPPHIIIWSHAANDAWGVFSANDIEEYQENFAEAARRMYPLCSQSGLPLIVMLNDLRADPPARLLETSAHIDRLATWYQLMSISHTHVVFHALLGQFPATKELLSSTWDEYHLGLFSHIGTSWVVLFGLLHALTTVCQTEFEHQQQQRAEPESTKSMSEVVMSTTNATQNKSAISSMQPDLPLQLLSRPYKTGEPFDRYSKEWQERAHQVQQRCQHNANQSQVQAHDNVCEYTWIKHSGEQYKQNGDGFLDLSDITHFLEPYMIHNSGWSYEPNPSSTVLIQPGWYAHKKQAGFILEFIPAKVHSQYFTLLHIKSYAETAFVNSMLNLTTEVVSSTTDKNSNIINITKATSSMIPGAAEPKVSVAYIHKHKLPGRGAVPGDTVRLHFNLASGHRFMILGMALCSRY